MASRPTFWSRYIQSGPQQTTASFIETVATIAPGQTLLRTIVCLDLYIDSASTLWPQLDAGAAWGLMPLKEGETNILLPYDGASSIDPRWIFWDQVTWITEEASDVAGTIAYLARIDPHNRYTDTRSQYRNNITGYNQPLQLGFQWKLSPFPANTAIDMSFSVQCLIEEAA